MVRVEPHGETAVVTFSRPPMNAFNLAFVVELRERLAALAADPPGAGVVLTGDGVAFSAGVDVKEVPAYSPADQAAMIDAINAMVTALYGLPLPTVAAVNGHAIGAGFIVMLSCDARVGADVPAKLALSEVTAGIPYPACPIEVVRSEIEPSYRRHLVLSGSAIAPADALDHGIIDELCEPGELLSRAVEIARTRASASAYAAIKQQLRAGALARMQQTIAGSHDPLLERWIDGSAPGG